jgi:putative ABC transport system substrate-binding protein
MRRREFITLFGGAVAIAPLASRAQELQPATMRRLGVLMFFPEDNREGDAIFALLRSELKQRGWVDGQNLEIVGGLTRNRAVLSAKAKEIVARLPVAIFASPTLALLPLLKETSTIPIVFAGVSDPLSQGIITNLAHPGGHVTGFSNPPFTVLGKSLQMLKDIDPTISRVAFIISDGNGSAPAYFRVFDRMAKSLSLAAVTLPVHTRSDIETSITSFATEPKGALIVPRDNFLELNRDLLIKLAAVHHLPTIYSRRSFAIDGGLISYGSDPDNEYRGAASYVARILGGEKPGNLPVQEPTDYELVINLRTAKVLGLSMPLPLLGRADKVIE